jgi:microcystin-dependent protein
MSNCSGCYNNCSEITSDQCVKYTGSAIPSLDISTGDTLAMVEQKIVTYLLTVMDGTGIIPDLPDTICTLVQTYLPESGDITLVDVVAALIQAACDLQVQVTALSASVDVIEADYTTGACLSGVTASSGTHAILQAVINSLCGISLNVLALQSALSAYVRIADINTYIQDYLDSLGSTKHYLKMVPYTAVEYYGTLTGRFDLTGAGLGDWEKIYLCNGQNGTPDKRGRIGVGTNTMGNGAYASPETNPMVSGNPTYDLYDVAGRNNVSLATVNVPAHTHVATSVVTDPGHKHVFVTDTNVISEEGYTVVSSLSTPHSFDGTVTPRLRNVYTKNIDESNNPQTTGITVNTTLTNTGGSQSHENRPPVIACHYIMHIP